jgi:hypothetical protein
VISGGTDADQAPPFVNAAAEQPKRISRSGDRIVGPRSLAAFCAAWRSEAEKSARVQHSAENSAVLCAASYSATAEAPNLVDADPVLLGAALDLGL